MKFLTAVFCLFAVIGSSLSKNEDWEHFKRDYGKTYRSTFEEKFRKAVFDANTERINAHNKLAKEGKFSYRLGINKFADLLNGEYQRLMTVKQELPVRTIPESKGQKISHAGLQDVPDEVDWVTSGCVTPVSASEGECTEWPIVTVETIEIGHCIFTGNFVSLSEQNLLDCTISYGNLGCDGGTVDNAYKYVRDNGGIDTEESYPNEGRVGLCRFNLANVGASITGYIDIQKGDEAGMKESVAINGTVAVNVDASHASFQLYTSGVYYEPLCSNTTLNHRMIVVGYGTEADDDYWLVKNSWGINWGMDGYIKMARNRDNNCGIASDASFPLFR